MNDVDFHYLKYAGSKEMKPALNMQLCDPVIASAPLNIGRCVRLPHFSPGNPRKEYRYVDVAVHVQ